MVCYKKWLIYADLFADENMLFFDKYSDHSTFTTGEKGVLCVNLNNINLDDANFYEDDPIIIIYIRLLTWHNKLKQRKAFKKEIKKKLMPLAWHPTRWWD